MRYESPRASLAASLFLRWRRMRGASKITSSEQDFDLADKDKDNHHKCNNDINSNNHNNRTHGSPKITSSERDFDLADKDKDNYHKCNNNNNSKNHNNRTPGAPKITSSEKRFRFDCRPSQRQRRLLQIQRQQQPQQDAWSVFLIDCE